VLTSGLQRPHTRCSSKLGLVKVLGRTAHFFSFFPFLYSLVVVVVVVVVVAAAAAAAAAAVVVVVDDDVVVGQATDSHWKKYIQWTVSPLLPPSPLSLSLSNCCS
jgi:asparagine N-glycosylation enzyme membrane subunit Stt3